MKLSEYRPQPQLRVPGSHVDQAAVPAIDAHNHLGRWLTCHWAVHDVGALLGLMDACNIRAIVNLDGRWEDELDDNLDRYDRKYPGRFLTFCHVDWNHIGQDGVLAASLRRSVEAGARGLKVWKDLGLHVRDSAGHLVLPLDPRLAGPWAPAGEGASPAATHASE